MRRTNGGWLALGASLALHAGAALGLWLSLSKIVEARHDLPVMIDTLVEAPEVTVDLDDVRRPRPYPLPKLEPAPPSHASSSAPSPVIRAQWTDSTEDDPEHKGGPLHGRASPGEHASTGAGSANPNEDNDGGGARFFGAARQARTVVYVIDRSASMGTEGGLAAAKRELHASLERLAPTIRFQVIVYNRYETLLPFAGPRELLAATPENCQRALRFVDDVRAEGGTDHLVGLKRALTLEPEAIFFVTDADDFSESQVHVITAINRGRSVIDAIRVSPSARANGAALLEKLARQNGGTYRLAVLANDP